MNKGPDKNGGPSGPSYSPGTINALHRKVLILASLIGAALTAAAGCDFNETKYYPDPTKVERCYDPNYRNQFPFHERMEIALAIHFVLSEDGNSPMNLDAVKEDVDELRRLYGSFVQDIYVTSVDYFTDNTLLPENAPIGETDEQYKERFRDFVDITAVDGAVDIYYIPSPIAVGESGKAGFHTYSGQEDAIAIFTDEDGQPYAKKTVSHEMGHYFGLEHPNNPPDRFESTLDIAGECPTPEYITYIDQNTGKCMQACSADISIAQEANNMGYTTCAVIDYLEPDQTLTLEQLLYSSCYSWTVKPQNVNQDLPRDERF